MGAFPWSCADCSFVPDAWREDPRPCPRCGGLAFRNGALVLRVTAAVPGRHQVQFGTVPPGPMASSFAAGPTPLDRRYLRSLRIGW